MMPKLTHINIVFFIHFISLLLFIKQSKLVIPSTLTDFVLCIFLFMYSVSSKLKCEREKKKHSRFVARVCYARSFNWPKLCNLKVVENPQKSGSLEKCMRNKNIIWQGYSELKFCEKMCSFTALAAFYALIVDTNKSQPLAFFYVTYIEHIFNLYKINGQQSFR